MPERNSLKARLAQRNSTNSNGSANAETNSNANPVSNPVNMLGGISGASLEKIKAKANKIR